MKELSIEDKAKRYDEVITMAKECITYIPDDAVNKYMLNMFPELKESEDKDEKIRKALIDFFNKGAENEAQTNGVCDKDIIAWLEKQGEQKPAWGEEDERMFHTIIADLKGFKHGNTSTLAPHFDNCIAWLKSLKDRVGCEANCTTTKEWNEEDEKNFARVDYACLKVYGGDSYSSDWLRKFLGIHKKWKPSEEQMITLRRVISGCSYDIEPLVEIEEQLKKLREE